MCTDLCTYHFDYRVTHFAGFPLMVTDCHFIQPSTVQSNHAFPKHSLERSCEPPAFASLPFTDARTVVRTIPRMRIAEKAALSSHFHLINMEGLCQLFQNLSVNSRARNHSINDL